MGKVFAVVLHDWSWANTGDYPVRVFDNEELANKQAEWFRENLELLDGDRVEVCEFDISTDIVKYGKGETISGWLYTPFDEEEAP